MLDLASFEFSLLFSRDGLRRAPEQILSLSEFAGVPVKFPEQEAEVGDWIVRLAGFCNLLDVPQHVYVQVVGVDDAVPWRQFEFYPS